MALSKAISRSFQVNLLIKAGHDNSEGTKPYLFVNFLSIRSHLEACDIIISGYSITDCIILKKIENLIKTQYTNCHAL